MKKKLLLLLSFLLVIETALQAVINRISFWSKALVIVHDNHDEPSNQTQDRVRIEEHKKENELLINSLKRNENPIKYYVESGDWLTNTLKKNRQLYAPLASFVATLDYVDKGAQQGSLTYECVDTRQEHQFILDAALAVPEVISKLVSFKDPFVQSLTNFTIQRYKEDIDERSRRVSLAEDSLARLVERPLPADIALSKESNDLAGCLKDQLDVFCRQYGVEQTQNIVNLIACLSKQDRNILRQLVILEGKREMDVNLLKKIVALTIKKPGVAQIVHVGLLHACWLEKKLKSLGFGLNEDYSVSHAFPQKFAAEVIHFIDREPSLLQ